jgi:hypothetical protein
LEDTVIVSDDAGQFRVGVRALCWVQYLESDLILSVETEGLTRKGITRDCRNAGRSGLGFHGLAGSGSIPAASDFFRFVTMYRLVVAGLAWTR